jgi:glucose 1-dehydrogenase
MMRAASRVRDPRRVDRARAIATPINKDVLENPKERRRVEAEIPLGRWGEVSDVANAVAWVASEQAQYLVGATIFVDGGMTLYPRFV